MIAEKEIYIKSRWKKYVEKANKLTIKYMLRIQINGKNRNNRKLSLVTSDNSVKSLFYQTIIDRRTLK